MLSNPFRAYFAVARSILASKVSQRMGADLRYDLFEDYIFLRAALINWLNHITHDQ